MNEKDQRICDFIRAVIAAKNVPKKVLARKCDVSTSMFSLLLHGDRKMTTAIKAKLIEELELKPYIKRLGL